MKKISLLLIFSLLTLLLATSCAPGEVPAEVDVTANPAEITAEIPDEKTDDTPAEQSAFSEEDIKNYFLPPEELAKVLAELKEGKGYMEPSYNYVLNGFSDVLAAAQAVVRATAVRTEKNASGVTERVYFTVSETYAGKTADEIFVCRMTGETGSFRCGDEYILFLSERDGGADANGYDFACANDGVISLDAARKQLTVSSLVNDADLANWIKSNTPFAGFAVKSC